MTPWVLQFYRSFHNPTSEIPPHLLLNYNHNHHPHQTLEGFPSHFPMYIIFSPPRVASRDTHNSESSTSKANMPPRMKNGYRPRATKPESIPSVQPTKADTILVPALRSAAPSVKHPSRTARYWDMVKEQREEEEPEEIGEEEEKGEDEPEEICIEGEEDPEEVWMESGEEYGEGVFEEEPVEGGEVEEDEEEGDLQEIMEGEEGGAGEGEGGGEGLVEKALGPKNMSKQRDYEVFVGGLDRETTEMDLVKALRTAGDVVDVRLVRRNFSQYSKGFAFVRFATVEQARTAATKLRFIQVRGNSCGVTRSNRNETLHLGNICLSWSKDDLFEKLKDYKLENLEEVHLIDDPNNNGKNRGYAFLDFSTHTDALAACCKLQKKEVFLGTDVRAEISFSKSIEPDEEVMAQVKSVFVDGLPIAWDEFQVQKHFKKFGEIESVQLACNMPSAKRQDFCFISFKTREAALNCIDKISNDGITVGSEKISLKATLKRPWRRLPVNMGAWRGYMNRNSERNVSKSYETGSSSNRHTRIWEGSDNYSNKIRGLGQFSSRQGDCRTTTSPAVGAYERQPRRPYIREVPENYESQTRREYIREVSEKYENRTRREYVRDVPEKYLRQYRTEYVGEIPEEFENHPRRLYVRELPGPDAAYSRSRDRYIESISSSRRALGSYRDVETYTQVLYPGDDIYDAHFDHFVSSPSDNYDRPMLAGIKRRHSDFDGDLLASSPMTRHYRSRTVYEVDDYPQHRVSGHVDYPRILQERALPERVLPERILTERTKPERTIPDEHFGYEKAELMSRSYGNGSSRSRSYY